ncbi:c-type cytochrome [Bacterioplanoides sp.]|uniref:c-type cytochrome n=1 Tax=Bacterioplanoides sp. TaxID=2066072 RepID=UPI003B59F2C6
MKKLAVMAAAVVAMSANVNAFDVDAKYKQACAACHAMGVAGAPKAFDKAAWEPRIATGMDKMVASVTNGKGAMPPRGLCMDCTPDQYKQLINHMAAPKQ